MRQSSRKTAPDDLPARDRILHVAQDLFYRHGIRATGVDRIIAEAGVTKVTFYRHFPSKDDLIRAYLHQRHETWIRWFKDGLATSQAAQPAAERRAQPLMPLFHVAQDWFATETFRGCAFANTMAEVGDSVPAITGMVVEHKHEVRDAIAGLLPPGAETSEIAWAATLALDGAAVNARPGGAAAEAALAGLRSLLQALARDRRDTSSP